MRSFLKGRKLWLYVTGDIPKPTKVTAQSEDAFRTRLIDWDSKHHQILTWFRNTTIPSIAALFGSFDDAQGSWVKVLGICLLLATPRLMVLGSTRLFLISFI
jgi:hypothetical protein